MRLPSLLRVGLVVTLLGDAGAWSYLLLSLGFVRRGIVGVLVVVLVLVVAHVLADLFCQGQDLREG